MTRGPRPLGCCVVVVVRARTSSASKIMRLCSPDPRAVRHSSPSAMPLMRQEGRLTMRGRSTKLTPLGHRTTLGIWLGEGALEPEIDAALWAMSHATDVPPTGRCWVASMIAQTDPDVPAKLLDRRARETWDACGLTRIPASPDHRKNSRVLQNLIFQGDQSAVFCLPAVHQAPRAEAHSRDGMETPYSRW